MAKSEKQKGSKIIILILIALAAGAAVLLIAKNKGKSAGDVIKDIVKDVKDAAKPGGATWASPGNSPVYESDQEIFPASEGWVYWELDGGNKRYANTQYNFEQDSAGHKVYTAASGERYYIDADGCTRWESGAVACEG
ncbi:MAG: hypothetical protein FWD39_02010 [Clostridiales bacterium]|nr:hypothetical protein [Clostridiales bacterium]